MSSRTSIERSLRAISVGSYLFQCGVASELALHPSDLQALHAIGRSGQLTAGELSVQLALTTGATTALIDRLERRGWVARQPDPGDRRRVLVRLCEENLTELRARYAPIDRRIRRLLSKRSPQELAVIESFLQELVSGS